MAIDMQSCFTYNSYKTFVREENKYHKHNAKNVNIAEEMVLPAPEKGQIHNGREGIEKLENECFEDEPLFKALVCLWNL